MSQRKGKLNLNPSNRHGASVTLVVKHDHISHLFLFLSADAWELPTKNIPFRKKGRNLNSTGGNNAAIFCYFQNASLSNLHFSVENKSKIIQSWEVEVLIFLHFLL